MRATVLESINGIITKEFIFSNSAIEKRDFDSKTNYKFNSFEFEFNNIEQLYDSLFLFTQEPKLCIIRGLAKNTVNTNIRRLGESNGDKAIFFDVPQEWVSFDIDDVEIPSAVSLDEIGEYLLLTELVPLLPEAANTDYIFQHSSSAGVFDSGHKATQLVSGHFWFLCDPVTCEEMRRWGDFVDWADPSLFKSVQPHYIATPVFTNMADPIGDKRYVLHKEANRRLSIPVPQKAQVTRALQTRHFDSNGSTGAWMTYIKGIKTNSAHPYILKAVSAYWATHGVNCDWAAFSYEVVKQMGAVGHERSHDVDSLLDEIGEARIGAQRRFPSLNLPLPPKYKDLEFVKSQLESLKRNMLR